MEPLNWLTILQVVSNLAIVGTFIVYWRLLNAAQQQLQANQEQVAANREATQTQSLLTAITFLQQDHIHEARATLIGMSSFPLQSWTSAERRAADVALGTYDIIAILCRRGVLPTDVIVDNWGDSIIKCREKAAELIATYRAPSTRGPAFWDDLEWLYNECKRSPLWRKDAA